MFTYHRLTTLNMKFGDQCVAKLLCSHWLQLKMNMALWWCVPAIPTKEMITGSQNCTDNKS